MCRCFRVGGVGADTLPPGLTSHSSALEPVLGQQWISLGAAEVSMLSTMPWG